MIKYIDNLEGIEPNQLEGFFINWPNPPSKEIHYKLLKNSSYVWIAIDTDTNKVVGFITAISDKVLSAYIPLLEVTTNYQERGIGKQLVAEMLNTLKDIYMIDLICDDSLMPFYEQFEMFKANGLMKRNFKGQNGLWRF